jgi:hypothetical protein
VLSPNQKGAIAETAIIHAAVKLRIPVLKPIADERYDLVLDLGSRFVRVQCKTATWRGSVVTIPCYSARRSAAGLVRRCYTVAEIDAIAAYSADLNRCYLVPASRIDGRSEIRLRVEPTLNNQSLGVNWAADFEFAATLERHFLGP